MLDHPHGGAVLDLPGKIGLGIPQDLHAFAQPQRIQRAEDKGPMAAL